MSPQMNGQPRDAEFADPPLSAPINTDGVTKTVVRVNGLLAPLITQDAATDFRRRWDLAQRSFVDDPREAVHAADELVAQVTKTLAKTLAGQRSELERTSVQAEAPTTEQLRIALRQYRSFFERLLSI